MIALTLDESDVRGFMNSLLKEGLFDFFDVRMVEMTSLTRVEISGVLDDGGKNGQEVESGKPSPKASYANWGQLRPLVVEIIKNHGMPRHMKIVFSLDTVSTVDFYPNASALFLNLLYENSMVNFTSATAEKQFSLDKTLDEMWGNYIKSFFGKCNIPVKEKA